MTQALDRLRKSRELGYSDDQIMHFLAETRGYSRSESEERIRKSLSGGYSTEDIVTLWGVFAGRLGVFCGWFGGGLGAVCG